jgi:hypothetical protein
MTFPSRIFAGMLALVSLGAQAADACDTCGCRRNGLACDPAEAHAAQPAILNFTSFKAARDSSGSEPQASTDSFKFAVVGDTQGLAFLEKLTTDMNAHNPALVVYPGDLVDTGSVPAWNQWKALSQHFVGGPTMRLPVPGNHDLPVGGDLQWQQTFNWLPNSPVIGGAKGIDKMDYFVDYQNSRFISVTTDSQVQGVGGPPAAQQWLTNLLNDQSTQSKDHVFVYSHHPITFNNYDGTGGTSGPWWQSMAQSGVVDSVFVGHWHQYQPSQPDPYHDMWETIAGTGNTGFSGHSWQNKIGFTLVDVAGDRVVSRFYGDADNDGNYDDVMDEFVMSDPAPPPRGVVAYYGFHDATRNVDAAPAPLGKRNTGLYVGNAKTVAGPIHGPSLSLDGSGDYAYGGGIGDYNLSILRDLTISIRANFDQLSSGAFANTLVSHTSDVAGHTDREEIVNQPYNLRIRPDRKLEFFWERGNNNTKEIFTSTLAADIDPGEWHEYRVTRDATFGQVAFYVDGVQLGATLSFDALTKLPTGGAQGTLHIGINYNRDVAGPPGASSKLVGAFDGLVDELVIWNEATTAAFVPPNLPCDLFADLTGDCILNAADWMQFRSGQFLNMTGMTLAEAAALGDLNGDLRNDHEDFVLFKSAFEATNGPGSFAAMLAVPEPAGASLAMLALVSMTRRRRARRQA